MGKIATRQYVSTLGGGNLSGDETRGATKKWIADNYNNVTVSGNYAENRLVKEEDLSRKAVSGTMNVFNNWLAANRYYARIGVTSDPTDERIPFQYENATFSLRGCGIVLEDGTIKTWTICDRQYNTASYNNNLVAPCCLCEKYLLVRNGTGSRGNNYIGIIDTITGNVIWYNDFTYKYVGAFTFSEILDGEAKFYSNISSSYRPQLCISVNINSDAVTITKSSDVSYRGHLASAYLTCKEVDLYRGVIMDDSTYNGFDIVSNIEGMNFMGDSVKLIKTFNNFKSPWGYHFALCTLTQNGLVALNASNNKNYWIDMDGNIIKALDQDPDYANSKRYLYIYKNGAIWKTVANELGNLYIKTDY